MDVELSIYRDILKSAPVFGSVTLLYDLLRLGRSRPRCLDSVEAELPDQSFRVAVDVVRMLNFIGNADLPHLQVGLGLHSFAVNSRKTKTNKRNYVRLGDVCKAF